ncbi:hypothetical protein ACLQ3B_01515 [Micromonospora sp. DT53]|uniref:hypothetical protein n=1 Tax=Micromonospora sp. DT53 TaxID=3393444 RepID=UPI003CF10874
MHAYYELVILASQKVGIAAMEILNAIVPDRDPETPSNKTRQDLAVATTSFLFAVRKELDMPSSEAQARMFPKG